MKVRWPRPVGEGSRISHAFDDIDREAAFEEIEPVASGGLLLPELAGPATHGRPGGRNPVAGPVFQGYGSDHRWQEEAGEIPWSTYLIRNLSMTSSTAPTPERARLYAQAHRISNGAACVLLVVQTEDGWAIHGLDLPGEGVYVTSDPGAGTGIRVSDDSMFVLAKSIVAKSDRSGR